MNLQQWSTKYINKVGLCLIYLSYNLPSIGFSAVVFLVILMVSIGSLASASSHESKKLSSEKLSLFTLGLQLALHHGFFVIQFHF